MMYCIKCGKQIPDDSRFCSFCGQKVVTVVEENAAPITPPPQPASTNTASGGSASMCASPSAGSVVEKGASNPSCAQGKVRQMPISVHFSSSMTTARYMLFSRSFALVCPCFHYINAFSTCKEPLRGLGRPCASKHRVYMAQGATLTVQPYSEAVPRHETYDYGGVQQ